MTVPSLCRDIWLVVHRDLLHNARVRAMCSFLAELFQRERLFIAGEGLVTPMSESVAPSRLPAAERKPRARSV